jgi:hypothetical protein
MIKSAANREIWSDGFHLEPHLAVSGIGILWLREVPPPDIELLQSYLTEYISVFNKTQVDRVAFASCVKQVSYLHLLIR